jgi:toxin ParE1/3/4
VANLFNLTPRAKEDLQGIWSYTHEFWSEAQADKYVTSLYERFGWLAERPRTGKHRPDICEGYYCFPQGSHLVFYLIRDNEIDIIGVPHNEMDVLNYFDTED